MGCALAIRLVYMARIATGMDADAAALAFPGLALNHADLALLDAMSWLLC